MTKDRTEMLAEAKKILTEFLEEKERELQLIRECLKIINEELGKRSFVTAEKLIIKPEEEWKKTSSITYRQGRREVLLAEVYIDRDGRNLKIEPKIKLNINTPPFQSFLLERVLNKMKEKDNMKVLYGEINPNEAIKYEVKTEDDMIKEIIIKNILSDERMMSIRNAVRWTFSRMYEKIGGAI